ncbi:MAG: hypothetical protein IT173_02630 [Acidobacteria bacterium]|nr:hypothetical protein [Acidobacteriota bacterium]
MKPEYSDVVKTILARPRNGAGGGIPLTRGEAAMLFFDGYAGDGPELLDVRALGYADDELWHGLTHSDVFSTDHDSDAAFIWSKWPPLELWLAHSIPQERDRLARTNRGA